MSLQDIALWIALPVLALTLIPVVIRLLRGPTLPDRVIALDLIAMLVMGMVSVYVIVTAQPLLIDLVTVLALLSFLGTVAFARYLEMRGRP